MVEAIEFVLRRLNSEHILFFLKKWCNSAQSGAFLLGPILASITLLCLRLFLNVAFADKKRTLNVI